MSPSSRLFCIHGHFYQPPREDPWLGRILIEPSAAPMRHWNERIVEESYGPVGWAHRTDGQGRIMEICNCYEWMSFNVGPTLMAWLERRSPKVYARVLEADAASCQRWGHGNAIAQVYHHAIMPLASALDKELETTWAVADFAKRFGRQPEGMWLAESAVDTATLEVLANAGISFVILAPRQARAVAGPGGDFVPVAENGFDVTKPYRVDLPSGASMSVFFYHGPLSQAVAFERLLENGEAFWNRINAGAAGGLLTLATDGETYGHHFHFGEMALAYVLAQGREQRDGLGLTNPGAYLAANPPTDRVLLHEPSSWSCVHGVERWRSDCGCKDGGHPDWNQRWRAPLRTALATAKAALDEHFFSAGQGCFADPRRALLAFGSVLADRGESGAFAREHITAHDQDGINRAWKLLIMQEQGLAAFASCAWFFDDISRIEPVNAMTFMWRAMELALDTGGPDLREAFRFDLAQAVSNKPEEGSGADILDRRVLPRQQDKASLCLLALLLLDIMDALPEPGSEKEFAWPAFSVRLTVDSPTESVARESGQNCDRALTGTARIGTQLERGGESFIWEWRAPGKKGTDRSFPVMDESSVRVTLPDGERQERSFSAMPRHIRAYVAYRAVMARREKSEAECMATARNALSLMDPWEEAQNTMPGVWDWATLVPYLLAACVLDDAATPEKRAQTRAFVDGLGVSQAMREQACRHVRTKMLDALAVDPPECETVAAWVDRAGIYLPELVLWPVRNACAGLSSTVPGRDALAAALGFVR